MLGIDAQVPALLAVDRAVFDPLHGEHRLAIDDLVVEGPLLVVGIGPETLAGRFLPGQDAGQLLELAEAEAALDGN